MAKKKATKAKPVADAPRFTEAQQQVIDHVAGPMLAGAVAGAGKSSSIVERVAKLHASGVPLNRVMLSAFNVDAAADLNRKLKKRLNMKGADFEVARTLHGLAYAIWKSSPGSQGFALDKSGSTYGRAIRQGAYAVGYEHVEADLVKKFASRVKNDCLVNSFVVGLRALGRTPSELVDVAASLVRAKKNCATKPEVLLDQYFAAEDARVSGTQLPDGTWSKFVTFDDLISEAARLLTEDDAVRTQWQERFDYVIVDEAQDLNEAQWRIVNALGQGHENIAVIGDPGQAIYTFRGAKPEHFLDFGKTWPGAKRVFMAENFRSGSDIIRVANVVLDAIPAAQKLPMRLQCTRDSAGFVAYRETDSPRTEAEDIALNIRKHHDAGVEWRDQAILVRRNDQSGRLELELLKAKIPARVVRGNSFFASREAKTALAYLRLIANVADEDDFEVTIQNPPKYLGRVFIDAIARAWKADLDWLDVMDASAVVADRKYNANARDFMAKIRELRVSFEKGATPLQLFTKLCQKMSWERWLEAEADKEAAPDNDAAMNFDRVREFLADFSDVPSLLATIAELKAAQRSAASSRNAVSIATVHSCVAPETLVETDRGVMEIRDIHATGTVGTGDGAKAFRNVVRNQVRPMLRIIADGGYEVTVTTDHRLMSWTGKEYASVRADALVPGSWLRLRLGAQADPTEPAPLPARPPSDVRAAKHPLPSHVTAEVAELFGMIVADGTVFGSGFRVVKRHLDMCERVALLTRRVFGYEARVGSYRSLHDDADVYTADVSSTMLSDWLLAVGGMAPNEKAVPTCIMRSPATIQAAFLRGLMEDGTVNLYYNASEKVDHVAWHTVYERMSELVQMLLLRQGIISTRFVPVPGKGWRVAIYGDDVGVFIDRIGFVTRFKNDRLAEGWSPAKRGNRVLPVDPEHVRRIVPHSKTNYDRANAIHRSHVSRRVAQKFHMTEELGWHHVRVESVVPTLGESMCVEVPGFGRFLQNGFDGSNCKGLEYQVVYIAGMIKGTWPVAWGNDDPVDERRVFYVAVTRARDELWFNGYRYKDDDATKDAELSPYLKELELSPTDRLGRAVITSGQMTLLGETES